MDLYTLFLTSMIVLFALSSGVLFLTALAQVLRRRRHRAMIYLGLMLLSCVVAAGFYFFRRLIE